MKSNGIDKRLTPKVPLFGIISGIVCSIIIVGWIFGNLIRMVYSSNPINQSNWLQSLLSRYSILMVGYDAEIMDVSMRWIRKLLEFFHYWHHVTYF